MCPVLTASIISAIVGAGALISSSVMAAKKAKDADRERRKQEAANERERAFNEDWFNKRYYKDPMERAEIKNALMRASERLDEERIKDEARGVVTGQTDESRLRAADVRQKAYTNAVQDIAANANRLKDAYDSQYMSSVEKYFDHLNGNYQANAQALTQMSNNWVQSAGNAAKLMGQGVAGIAKQYSPKNNNAYGGG